MKKENKLAESKTLQTKVRSSLSAHSGAVKTRVRLPKSSLVSVKKADRPKIIVSRSNKNIFVQLVDGQTGRTLAGLSTQSLKEKLSKKEAAFKLGELFAQQVLKLKIKKVSFNRNSYRYHGRVESLANGLRKGGLEF